MEENIQIPYYQYKFSINFTSFSVLRLATDYTTVLSRCHRHTNEQDKFWPIFWTFEYYKNWINKTMREKGAIFYKNLFFEIENTKAAKYGTIETHPCQHGQQVPVLSYLILPLFSLFQYLILERVTIGYTRILFLCKWNKTKLTGNRVDVKEGCHVPQPKIVILLYMLYQ
jgi:hypothetical protein